MFSRTQTAIEPFHSPTGCKSAAMSRGWIFRATAGTGALGATMFINTNQSASGRIGFAVALGAGNTFPAGNRELARVTFQALPTASGSFTPIFTDQPAWRDVSDVTAVSLPIGY